MTSPQHAIRWIDLTAEQKKQVLRMRNTESARRSRDRKRQQQQTVERAYQENEKRIEELESLVQSLSAELRTPRRPSSHAQTASHRQRTGHSASASSWSSSSTTTGELPDWFGDPF